MTTGDRVRGAAVRLFAEKGFHGTGIRDLAQAAGLSSASLYHYMGTKEELLAVIMRECLERLLDGAAKATEGVADPRERLGRLVALHVMSHALQPDETRVVDNELRALSPAAQEPVVRLRDAYERLWASAIADGIAGGVFTADEPSITRLALLEMCNGVSRWYSPRGPLTLEALAAEYARLALRALESTGNGPDPDLRYCRAVVADVWNTPNPHAAPCSDGITGGRSKGD
ncbi:TetR/AcrR family transcriptional regulator [Amycolatopsis magusensis]|uniref:TetR/AcrR family transcriptional regulator n=1 Tax=Amycolatopsis magusensis TaxID=882444 RepID=UPI0024A9ED55|nr:TetR/AcrR family transcriptional regulator [Amycolatopsis magusensis]MDI5975218.1 TetR/AcrR family transcriptional regulator [Amycolatopsis magusensis]